MRASRSAKPAVDAEHVDEGAPAEESVSEAVRDELGAAGRLASPTGRAVLALARRIDGGNRESGASLSALVKEFRASMAEALKGADQTADPVDALRAKNDELRARRERKHTG